MKRKEKFFKAYTKNYKNKYNRNFYYENKYIEIFYINKECLAFKLLVCNMSVDTDFNKI